MKIELETQGSQNTTKTEEKVSNNRMKQYWKN